MQILHTFLVGDDEFTDHVRVDGEQTVFGFVVGDGGEG